jgi:CcmD family protein
MVNTYLFLAYALVWLIFILYAWNLSRRQDELKRELEDLKTKILVKRDSGGP